MAAKLPEHLRLMLERCATDPLLVLTASCGCEVGTVKDHSIELPYVDVCKDHRDALLKCVEPEELN